MQHEKCKLRDASHAGCRDKWLPIEQSSRIYAGCGLKLKPYRSWRCWGTNLRPLSKCSETTLSHNIILTLNSFWENGYLGLLQGPQIAGRHEYLQRHTLAKPKGRVGGMSRRRWNIHVSRMMCSHNEWNTMRALPFMRSAWLPHDSMFSSNSTMFSLQ